MSYDYRMVGGLTGVTGSETLYEAQGVFMSTSLVVTNSRDSGNALPAQYTIKITGGSGVDDIAVVADRLIAVGEEPHVYKLGLILTEADEQSLVVECDNAAVHFSLFGSETPSGGN